MGIEAIILLSALLFLIIYFAVKLAIHPLLSEPEQIIDDNQDFGLVKLRDIEILSDNELEDVIELYQNKSAKKVNYEQYQKYAKVLDELKEMSYFTEEKYFNRLDKLKKYFKVD